MTIEADIIKQKLPENNGGYNALSSKENPYGKTDKRIYTELTTDHPIDLCRYQVANCYMGRAGLINSGGASGENDFAEAVKTAVINKRAGGMGLISGPQGLPAPDGRGREAAERDPGRVPLQGRHGRLVTDASEARVRSRRRCRPRAARPAAALFPAPSPEPPSELVWRMLGEPLSMKQHDLPVRGVPLRWRLGLSTSVIVTLVLGSLTFFFQKNEVERSREDRERSWGRPPRRSPRTSRRRPGVGGGPGAPADLRGGALEAGVPAPARPLRDARGSPGRLPLSGPAAGAASRLAARADPGRLGSILPGGRGTLEVWQDGAEFQAMVGSPLEVLAPEHRGGDRLHPPLALRRLPAPHRPARCAGSCTA